MRLICNRVYDFTHKTPALLNASQGFPNKHRQTRRSACWLRLHIDIDLLQLAVNVAMLPLVVLSHVSLLLSRELTQSVNHFTVVVLAITDVIVGAEQSNIDLTGTCADMIPVDEVDMCEFAQIQLAILNGQSLASAKKTERRWPSVFMEVKLPGSLT